MKYDQVRVTTDRQTDGQTENNRAPLTLVGGGAKLRHYHSWLAQQYLTFYQH